MDVFVTLSLVFGDGAFLVVQIIQYFPSCSICIPIFLSFCITSIHLNFAFPALRIPFTSLFSLLYLPQSLYQQQLDSHM